MIADVLFEAQFLVIWMPKSHLMFSRVITTDFRWMFFYETCFEVNANEPNGGFKRTVTKYLCFCQVPLKVTVAFVSVDFETRNKVYKNIPNEHITIGMTQENMLFESHYEISF